LFEACLHWLSFLRKALKVIFLKMKQSVLFFFNLRIDELFVPFLWNYFHSVIKSLKITLWIRFLLDLYWRFVKRAKVSIHEFLVDLIVWNKRLSQFIISSVIKGNDILFLMLIWWRCTAGSSIYFVTWFYYSFWTYLRWANWLSEY